jgi:MFS transporter, DHA1 family, inner membrane transport protein
MPLRSISTVLPSGPARRPVLLLALGSFALGTDAYVISGVLPKVSQDLGISLTSAGLLITVFAGVYAVFAPPIAVFTGNVPRKRAMQMALTVFIAANVLAAVAPDFWTLIAARAIAALGAGMYTPAAAAAAASIVKPEERGRALATVIGGLTIATAVGVPIGTFIGLAGNWRFTFVFVAAMGLVALVGLTRSLGEIASPGVVSLRERIASITIKGMPGTLLAIVVGICGFFTIYTYMAWFAGKVGGLNGTAVTLIYVLYGVSAVIANFGAGSLIDRVSPTRVATFSLGSLVVTQGIFAVVGRFGNGSAGMAYVLGCLVVLWVLMGWLFYPALQKHAAVAAGPRATVALSLVASSVYAGQALAGVLGGALLRHGPASVALAATACALIALVIVSTATRTAKAVPDTAEPAPAASMSDAGQHH